MDGYDRGRRERNMPSIEVVTSITGDKDWIRDDQVVGGAVFTCFTDNPGMKSSVWDIKPSYSLFVDPRRNSRIHKLMIHKYSDAKYTIWIDGNIRLLMPPEEIVEKILGDYDMAMFMHGGRDCLYEEAIVCATLGLDDPEIIIEQAKHYEDSGFPKHRGLLSGGFIVRRNNQKTRDLNEAWWADYCRFSRRDQLSLMPAIDKVGVRVNMMPERWVQHDGFASIGGVIAICHHKNFSGNFNEIK